MTVTFGRIFSLVIAAGYVLAWKRNVDPTGISPYVLIFVLLFPLMLIWFPEEIGSFTGYAWGLMGNVDTETPPIFVSIMGWLFLLGLPVLFLLFFSPGHLRAPTGR